MRIATVLGGGFLCVGALAFGADQVGFEPPVVIEVGRSPSKVFAGDLDDDQNIDIVLSGPHSEFITVMLGNGDGTFDPGVEYRLPDEPLVLAAADLNGDDRLDIVTGHVGRLITRNPAYPNLESEGGVNVLLSNTRGGYDASQLTIQGRQPTTILFHDFDGDRDLDLFLGTQDGASAMNNDGFGAFDAARFLPDEYQPLTKPYAVADLNGDTFPDLVGHIPMYADRSGNFTMGNRIQGLGAEIVAADVDGDGDVDLASVQNPFFPTSTGSATVLVHLNDGSGNFTEDGGYATIAGPADLRAADLNKDGSPEMISRSQWGKVGVLVNAGDGSFEHLNTFRHAPNGTPWGVATADLDEDGRQDLITADLGTGGIPSTVAIHRGSAALPPMVSDFQPRSGVLGESLDISFDGGGFDAGATVEIAGFEVTVESVRVDSSTSLTVSVKIADALVSGVSAGPRDMVLRNSDGKSVPLTFTVNEGPLPVVNTVTPDTARAGDTLDLELTGSGFADDVDVNFGSNVAVNTVARQAADRIAANVTLGSSAGTLDFVVTNASTGRTTTLEDALTVLPPLTLELVPLKGKLIDRSRAGRDKIDVSGQVDFNAFSPDGAFSSVLDDVTVSVGDPAGPFVFSVTAGDSGWRVRNGKQVWKTPRRTRPRIRLEINSDRRTFRVVVSRADLSLPADGSVLVDITAGNDTGRTTRVWESFRRGLRLR